MPALSVNEARAILQACGLDGREDFHKLPSSKVELIIVRADARGYRVPKNANGSRARYFYAYLQRAAKPWHSWHVLSNHGYGWDTVCSDDEHADALQTLREYRENEPNALHTIRFQSDE